jgi:hypothetical protein
MAKAPLIKGVSATPLRERFAVRLSRIDLTYKRFRVNLGRLSTVSLIEAVA